VRQARAHLERRPSLRFLCESVECLPFLRHENCFPFAGTARQQFGRGCEIIEHFPSVYDGNIAVKKVVQATVKSSQDGRLGNIVSALLHAGSNALHGDGGTW
jgi:hypothetical protein